MYETLTIISVLLLIASLVWLAVSVVLLAFKAKRDKAKKNVIISASVILVASVSTVFSSQSIYKDYGLESSEGLAKARSERIARETNAAKEAEIEQAKRDATNKEAAKSAAIEQQKKKNEDAAKARADKEIARCSDNGMAFVMSQKFVKQKLKSPSTASFDYQPLSSTSLGLCKYRIIAFVDSQNGFGATIRTNYSIDMQLLPDNKWRGTNLVFK
ncbi:hypothetical protein ACTOV4_01115 [Brucella sp. C7-11G]